MSFAGLLQTALGATLGSVAGEFLNTKLFKSNVSQGTTSSDVNTFLDTTKPSTASTLLARPRAVENHPLGLHGMVESTQFW